MALKPLSEKDRLYFEMLRLYERLGVILRDYQAATTKPQPAQKKVVIIDPYTGKPYRGGKKNSPTAGSRRQRGLSRK